MPFARPTTTATPDEIFEEWVHVLTHAELLALLYVVRRTLGFKKAADAISYTQFLTGITTREGRVLDRGCGIKSRTTLAAALRHLEELGLIHSDKTRDARGDRATTRYGLRFASDGADATDDHDAGGRGAYPAAPPAHAVDGGRARTILPPCAGRTTGSTPPVLPVVRGSYQQQTVETTNTVQQTDLSKREARATTDTRDDGQRDSTDATTVLGCVAPITRGDPAVSPLSDHVARLAAELGDDAPRASRTRVLTLRHAAGLGDEAAGQLLDEAAAITRAHGATITKRGRDGGIVRMPYLLATFRDLVAAPRDGALDPAPSAAATVAAAPTDASAPDITLGAGGPLPHVETDPVWRAVLGEVREEVTAENYATWFAPARVVARDGDVLRVGVPTAFHRQWLMDRLSGRVERALRRTGHAHLRVTYDVVTLAAVLPDGGAPRGEGVDPVSGASPRAAPPAPVRAAPPLGAPRAASALSPHAALPDVVCPSCHAVSCDGRCADRPRRAPPPGGPMARVPHATGGLA